MQQFPGEHLVGLCSYKAAKLNKQSYSVKDIEEQIQRGTNALSL